MDCEFKPEVLEWGTVDDLAGSKPKLLVVADEGPRNSCCWNCFTDHERVPDAATFVLHHRGEYAAREAFLCGHCAGAIAGDPSRFAGIVTRQLKQMGWCNAHVVSDGQFATGEPT